MQKMYSHRLAASLGRFLGKQVPEKILLDSASAQRQHEQTSRSYEQIEFASALSIRMPRRLSKTFVSICDGQHQRGSRWANKARWKGGKGNRAVDGASVERQGFVRFRQQSTQQPCQATTVGLSQVTNHSIAFLWRPPGKPLSTSHGPFPLTEKHSSLLPSSYLLGIRTWRRCGVSHHQSRISRMTTTGVWLP